MPKQINVVGEKFAVFFTSIVRTLVPIVVGWVAAFLVSVGIEPDAQLLDTLGAFLSALFAALYYIVARLLEMYVTPKFGWLLGSAKSPVTYSDEQ